MKSTILSDSKKAQQKKQSTILQQLGMAMYWSGKDHDSKVFQRETSVDPYRSLIRLRYCHPRDLDKEITSFVQQNLDRIVLSSLISPRMPSSLVRREISESLRRRP